MRKLILLLAVALFISNCNSLDERNNKKSQDTKKTDEKEVIDYEEEKDNSSEKEKSSEIDIDDVLDISEEETTNIETAKVKTEVSEKTSEVEKEVVKKEATSKFYVIVGSLKNIDDAKKLEKKLNTKGYKNVELLNKKDGGYRVSVASFVDKNAATKELNKVKAIYKESWILKK